MIRHRGGWKAVGLWLKQLLRDAPPASDIGELIAANFDRERKWRST